jgi:predicted Zn-dependent protease with MMP-like domain
VTDAEFDEHVRAALDALPPQLAAALQNVAVVVEDENPEDPDLFGLYDGVPLTERGAEAQAGVVAAPRGSAAAPRHRK